VLIHGIVEEIHREMRPFTMIGPGRFTEILKLSFEMKSTLGDIVECGTWKGGMLAGIMKIMGQDRIYWGYDSFEGLPPAKAIDGEAAIAYQKNVSDPYYNDNCSAEQKWIESLFQEVPTLLRVVPGWFQETMSIAENLPGDIAILHLDGDWYESTMTCLTALYPRVVPNGLIILDDYSYWLGVKRAVHTYFNNEGLEIQIEEKNGVYFFRKPTIVEQV